MVNCYICIGSNYERERNLSFAVNELSLRLGNLCFAPAEETAAIGMKRGSSFLNQVALLTTSLSAAELKRLFKEIEREAGRTPEEKAQEIVRLDIDLLTYGDTLLKAEDMERDYVERGIALLKGRDTAIGAAADSGGETPER
jgi:2-amino-4-hydroxy-6-hydroxymethyldihydropteridine diphosphokinase